MALISEQRTKSKSDCKMIRAWHKPPLLAGALRSVSMVFTFIAKVGSAVDIYSCQIHVL